MKYVLLAIMLISCVYSNAQNNEIDSLERKINSEINDTRKVKAYCSLAVQYYYDNQQEKALTVLEEGIALAKKNNWKKGIGNCLLLRGKLNNNADKSLQDFNQAIKYFITIKDEILEGKGYEHLAGYYVQKNMIDTAINFNIRAINIFKKHKDSTQLGVALNTLGSAYIEKGDMDNAVLTYNELLKISSKLKDLKISSRAEGALANIYLMTGDTRKAVYRLNNAYELNKKLGNELGAAKYLKYLAAEEYTLDSNLTKAIDRLTVSMNAFSKDEIYYMTSEIAYEVGILYAENNRIDSAKKYLIKSYEDGIKSNDGRSMILGYLAKGTCHDITKNPKEAASLFLKSLELAKNLKMAMFYPGIYENLMLSYKKQGNYIKAFEYQSKYITLKDSLFNEEKSMQIAEMETKYDTEKKEAEILALASENEINSLELENKTLALNQINYMLIGLGGVLLLLGIVGYLFFQKRKIKTEQETAQLEQKLLRTQMNPHFMSNALMSIQTYMYENKTEEAVKYIGRFGKLTRQILSASREDYIPLNEEVSFIKNYLDFQQLMFPNKLDYNVVLDDSIEDEEEILIPPMLSQPFIENAIEHGIRHLQDRKGNVLVSFKQENDNLMLEIKDDGVGRTVSHEVNESVRKNHVSYSTNITNERIDLFKRKYKKNINFTIADLAVGTKVTFEIPLT